MKSTASTFEVARGVVAWAKEVDPGSNFQPEDLLPVCVGPLRRILEFSVHNLRNADKLTTLRRKLKRTPDFVAKKEKNESNLKKLAIVQQVEDALNEEAALKNESQDSLSELRRRDTEGLRILDDREAYLMREKIHKELREKREVDMASWQKAIKSTEEDIMMDESELLIAKIKAESASALEAIRSHALKLRQLAKPAESSGDKVETYDENEHMQKTFVELRASLLGDYLTASKMLTSAASKRREFIRTPEEDREIFRMSLALEVAMAERTCLKKLVWETDASLSDAYNAPADLEVQQTQSAQLKEKSANLKKKIASAAKANVAADKRVQEIIAFIFNGIPPPVSNTDAESEKEKEKEKDISTIVSESSKKRTSKPNAVDVSSSSSSAPTLSGDAATVSAWIKPGVGLDETLDERIDALANAITKLSGRFVSQTGALADVSVAALRRIVPDTVTDAYNVTIESQMHDEYKDSNKGHVASSMKQLLKSQRGEQSRAEKPLPVPLEDMSSRQAVDPTSAFRKLTSALGVPQSLCASTTLKTVSTLATKYGPPQQLLQLHDDTNTNNNIDDDDDDDDALVDGPATSRSRFGGSSSAAVLMSSVESLPFGGGLRNSVETDAETGNREAVTWYGQTSSGSRSRSPAAPASSMFYSTSPRGSAAAPPLTTSTPASASTGVNKHTTTASVTRFRQQQTHSRSSSPMAGQPTTTPQPQSQSQSQSQLRRPSRRHSSMVSIGGPPPPSIDAFTSLLDLAISSEELSNENNRELFVGKQHTIGTAAPVSESVAAAALSNDVDDINEGVDQEVVTAAATPAVVVAAGAVQSSSSSTGCINSSSSSSAAAVAPAASLIDTLDSLVKASERLGDCLVKARELRESFRPNPHVEETLLSKAIYEYWDQPAQTLISENETRVIDSSLGGALTFPQVVEIFRERDQRWRPGKR